MLDPEGNATFDHAGVKYTAVFNFRAMKAVEKHYDLPFFQAIQSVMPAVQPKDAEDAAKVEQAVLGLRLTDLGVLLGCALYKHHPDLAEDDVDEIIDGIGLNKVGEVLGEVISASVGRGDDNGSAANPRKTPRPKR